MIHKLTFAVVLAASMCFATQQAEKKNERSFEVIVTNNLNEPPVPVVVLNGEGVAEFYLSENAKLLARLEANPFGFREVEYDAAANIVAAKMRFSKSKRCLVFLRIKDPAKTNVAGLAQSLTKFESLFGDHVGFSVCLLYTSPSPRDRG